MNITNIEAITEENAAELCTEKMVIKGFNVYFVNLGESFGHSYLVFKNGHHINYANDYELHHSYMVEREGLDALKNYYVEQLNNKLFTEEEIGQPLKSYDEYEMKSRFLHSYYAMQEDYVSMFRIFRNEEDEKAFDKEVEGMLFNPVGFCYMDKSKTDFIKHHKELLDKLNAAKADVVNNYDYQKSAFLYEMYNHEYGINLQADWDVLSVFGKVTYRGDWDVLDDYFKELKFTETQKKAYRDARAEYYKQQQEVA